MFMSHSSETKEQLDLNKTFAQYTVNLEPRGKIVCCENKFPKKSVTSSESWKTSIFFKFLH